MSFDPVNERTSSLYTAKLVDQTGTALGLGIVETFTLTLYDKATGAILNGRSLQNVLNANGVTLDVNGNVSWTLAPADNVIITDARQFEVHIALFQAAWSSGSKTMNHEVPITVRNLAMVV